jgi:hypothetical protein
MTQNQSAPSCRGRPRNRILNLERSYSGNWSVVKAMVATLDRKIIPRGEPLFLAESEGNCFQFAHAKKRGRRRLFEGAKQDFNCHG